MTVITASSAAKAAENSAYTAPMPPVVVASVPIIKKHKFIPHF